jgi:hypothetical protein
VAAVGGVGRRALLFMVAREAGQSKSTLPESASSSIGGQVKKIRPGQETSDGRKEGNAGLIARFSS